VTMPATDPLTVAYAYAGAGRWADALRALAPVVAAEPDNVDALLLAAQCHLGLGDAASALAAAAAAGSLRPESSRAAVLQSAALARQQRHRDARTAADEAVRLAPDDPSAHQQRIAVDVVSRRVTAGGRASAEMALRLAPNEPAVHVEVGNLELVDRRLHAGMEHYRTALRIDPDNRAASYNLALLGNRAGGWRESVRLLLGLIRADPDDPRYTTSLRTVLSGVLILVGLVCAVAALSLTPSAERSPGSTGGFAIALTVCLFAQAAALAWMKWVAGPAAFRFLTARGRRGILVRAAAAALLIADMCLLVGLIVTAPNPALAGALAGAAMILAFVSLFAIIGSAVGDGP